MSPGQMKSACATPLANSTHLEFRQAGVRPPTGGRPASSASRATCVHVRRFGTPCARQHADMIRRWPGSALALPPAMATKACGILLLFGMTSCVGSNSISGAGGGGNGGPNPSMSCVADPDRPATCTSWTCMDTPGEFGTTTHCTANSPPGAAHPGGDYTCPAMGGGLYCPGNDAGGSGPWMCHADDAGRLTCDRGPGGMPPGGSMDGGLPPMPMLCMAGGANNEPEILVGYSPANGQSVGATGQIKVWVNDEGAPII